MGLSFLGSSMEAMSNFDDHNLLGTARHRSQVALGGFATGTLASSVFGPGPALVLEPALEPAHEPEPALALGLEPALGPETAPHDLRT